MVVCSEPRTLREDLQDAKSSATILEDAMEVAQLSLESSSEEVGAIRFIVTHSRYPLWSPALRHASPESCQHPGGILMSYNVYQGKA